MATQDGSGIALKLLAESEQKHFRLLELPAELLALLESDQAPVLELKASGGQDEVGGGHVSLCTFNKTFELRQKNSSNTTYVLEPQAPPEDILSGPILAAISQCHSTLEVNPSKATEVDVWAQTRALLPVYTSAGVPSGPSIQRQELIDGLPFSEQQCHDALLELAVFESPETRAVYRPSAAFALQVWQSILSDAIADDIDLEQPVDAARLASLRFGTSPTEMNLTKAVLALIRSSPSETQNPERCVCWVGRTLLEVEAAHVEIPTKTLLAKWQELLPEKWRSLADVSKLSSISQTSDGAKSIRLRASVFETPIGKGQGSAIGGAKRKWHEKFRPSKR